MRASGPPADAIEAPSRNSTSTLHQSRYRLHDDRDAATIRDVKLDTNTIYGWVVGTVLVSVMLAAIPPGQSPWYVGTWVLISVVAAAITRSYGQHVSTHHVDSPATFWQDLGRSMLTGIPMVVACVPTLLVLAVAAAAHWSDDTFTSDGTLVSVGYTTGALAVNAAVLFVLGAIAAFKSGYRKWQLCGIGLANTAIGLAVASLNLIIK